MNNEYKYRKSDNSPSKYQIYLYNKKKKLHKKRMHILNRFKKYACMLVILSILGSLCCGYESYAGLEHEEIPTYKYFTNIEIESGDTLESIADRYFSNEFRSKARYIKEVKYINHLDSDTIYAGTHIIVPYYSSELK